MKNSFRIIFFLLTFLPSFLITLSAQAPLFYGMTVEGGTDGFGAIFNFNPAVDTERVVWSFHDHPDGYLPVGDLTYYNGNCLFYGTSLQGGSNVGLGTIFNFNPVNDGLNVLWQFGSGTDGWLPHGNLVYYPGNGLFYGTTAQGGDMYGTIFNFNPSTDTENAIYYLGYGTDGRYPYGNLVYYAGTHSFYTTTSEGGNNALGAIISFNPDSNTEHVVWSLGNDSDGATPYGSLVYDNSNGLFYAMTNRGGGNNRGAIISFNPANNTENMVWSFGSGNDGLGPDGNLVYDPANDLFYGMTYNGGVNNLGAIISFNPADNTEHVVWNFGNDTDGYYPSGSLLYYLGNGLLYGMTSRGGNNDDAGVIFSFNPVNNAENMVWNFGSDTDGIYPHGSLVPYQPNNSLPAVAPITGPANICAGSNIILSDDTAGGVWQSNNSNIATISANGKVTSAVAGVDTITYRVTNGCGISSSVIYPLTVETVVTPAITITSSQATAFCAGITDTLTAIAIHGGYPVEYAWRNGNILLSIGDSIFISDTIPNGSIISCVLISNAACASPDTVISNSITVLVNPVPAVPTITQKGDTLICSLAVSYQWYLNDTLLNDDTTQQLVISRLGNYTVQVSDSIGCSNVSEGLNVLALGIVDIMPAYTAQLYPNPGNGNFALLLSDNIPRMVSITDLTGREIIAAQQITAHKDFDCTALAAAVYLLKIKDGKGVKTLKLMLVK